QPEQDIIKFLDMSGIYADSRFIKYKYARIADQCTCDEDTLRLSTREQRNIFFFQIADIQKFQYIVQSFPVLLPETPEQPFFLCQPAQYNFAYGCGKAF